jgi:L-asparaginase/Glu-tRNA(Gln) amidotransferase subunit D
LIDECYVRERYRIHQQFWRYHLECCVVDPVEEGASMASLPTVAVLTTVGTIASRLDPALAPSSRWSPATTCWRHCPRRPQSPRLRSKRSSPSPHRR